ncbi:MAG: DUF11 domain-containing protein [Candidatus Peribacteria bacterium]|nr:MAG: DUF11 domain-containing protein [Candidatus Peribacteria bacterium]
MDAQTASPLMRTWRASYDSTLAPSLSYTVQVTDDVALLSSLDALTNAASISTATPETIISNNYTQKIHYLTKTDLHIQKEVSQTAVQPGDEITYTITYENTGPHDATNVTIADVLPQNITVTSITTGTLA